MWLTTAEYLVVFLQHLSLHKMLTRLKIRGYEKEKEDQLISEFLAEWLKKESGFLNLKDALEKADSNLVEKEKNKKNGIEFGGLRKKIIKEILKAAEKKLH